MICAYESDSIIIFGMTLGPHRSFGVAVVGYNC